MPLVRLRADTPLQRLLEPALKITGEGLVLGGTVLAKMERARAGGPALVVDGGEERVLALLAVVYGEAIDHRVLAAIRRASSYWNTGEPDLAAIALAHAGLPPLDRAERASLRLSLAERLLDHGLSPRELVKVCDLDPALLDVLKAGYNPDQPRVPAGNPAGGQWTNDGFASDEVGYGPPTARPSTATSRSNHVPNPEALGRSDPATSSGCGSRIDRDQHRPRRNALLPPCRDDRRCPGIWAV